jgi:hypothetical protein|tara:strand:- start:720 stop:974 length:255 start_codon:yes stop_codon:yes gene_type:complete
MRNIPEWLVGILVYGVGIGLMAMILFMGGCSTTFHVLPGLCYESPTGTYLCGPEIKPDDLPPQKPIDPSEYMDPILNNEETRIV